LWDSVAYMAVLPPALLGLIPLIITPGLLFFFDVTPKVALLVAGTACLAPWAAPGARELWRSPFGRWFCLLALGQLASLAASALLSTDVPMSIGGTNWRRYGAIVQLAALLFALIVAAGGANLSVVLRTVAATGTAAAAYGILQYFGWDPLLPARSYHIGEGIWTIVRPPGTMGYVTYFAAYLLFVVFFGIGQARSDPHRGWRLMGWCAAATAAAAIVLSGTRAAMLGLAAGAAVMGWRRPSRRLVLGIAAFTAATAIFYFSPAGWKLRSRMRWFLEDPRGGPRMLLWRDSWRMGASRWVAGFGPDTFSAEFPRFQSVALARAYPDFYHESPHNMFLDAWTSQGLPGLVMLAGMCGLGAAVAVRSEPSPLRAALSAAFVAVLLAHQFACFTATTALFFYSTIALLVAPTSFQGWRWSRASWMLVPLSLCLVWFGARLVVADRILETVKTRLAAGRMSSAMDAYGRFERWKPVGMSADLWYSRSLAASAAKSSDPLVRVSASRQAIAIARRATRSAEDRHNAFYNLAVMCGLENDAPCVHDSLRATIDRAPNWFKPHWTLARVLAARGQIAEARAEAALALELSGGKYQEVARTFHELWQK